MSNATRRSAQLTSSFPHGQNESTTIASSRINARPAHLARLACASARAKRTTHALVIGLVVGLACACGPPHRDVPAADVPKLTSLKEVMDVQATIADPQMKKAGETTYAEPDYAAFAEVSNRIQATSTKAKEFSRGPGFDALADRLHETAAGLGKAAAAKDAAASSSALTAMKATCKECHSKFR